MLQLGLLFGLLRCLLRRRPGLLFRLFVLLLFGIDLVLLARPGLLLLRGPFRDRAPDGLLLLLYHLGQRVQFLKHKHILKGCA